MNRTGPPLDYFYHFYKGSDNGDLIVSLRLAPAGTLLREIAYTDTYLYGHYNLTTNRICYDIPDPESSDPKVRNFPAILLACGQAARKAPWWIVATLKKSEHYIRLDLDRFPFPIDPKPEMR